MRNITVVDESGNKIDIEHEISFKPFIPRIGESISMVRYLKGDQDIGRGYYEVVDRVDKYSVIDVEHIIYPTFNSCTAIDVNIIVKLL